MTEKNRTGFRAMDPETQRTIAGQGGRTAHRLGRAHIFSSEEVQKAGKRGGAAVAADRSHMSNIARKGTRSRQTKPQIVRTQNHTPEDRIAVEWAKARLATIKTRNRRALAKLLGLSPSFLQRLALGELVPARPLLALIHMLSVNPEMGQALEAFWRDYDAAIQVPPPALEPPTVSDG